MKLKLMLMTFAFLFNAKYSARSTSERYPLPSAPELSRSAARRGQVDRTGDDRAVAKGRVFRVAVEDRHRRLIEDGHRRLIHEARVAVEDRHR